jgi:Glycosyl transferases group 1
VREAPARRVPAPTATTARLRVAFCARGVPADPWHRVVPPLLRARTVEVREAAGEPDALAGVDAVLLCENAAWFPRVWSRLAVETSPARPPLALWHTEPLPPPQSSGRRGPRLSARELAKILLRDPRATDPFSNAATLRRLTARGLPDVLAVSTRGAQRFLAERGVRSHWIPLGYDPEWFGRNVQRPEREVDVLFLGDLRVRRRRSALRRLERAGARVAALGSWSDSRSWGESRTELLNRAKIFLHLTRVPGSLSGLRMLLGMANGALVVSEPIDDPAPYEPDVHFVEAPADGLEKAVLRALESDADRERIAAAAEAFVTEELTMERPVAALHRLLASRVRVG